MPPDSIFFTYRTWNKEYQNECFLNHLTILENFHYIDAIVRNNQATKTLCEIDAITAHFIED